LPPAQAPEGADAPAAGGAELAPSTRKPSPLPSGPTPRPLPPVVAQMLLFEPWLNAADGGLEMTLFFYRKAGDGELFFDGVRVRIDYAFYTAVSGAKGELLGKGATAMSGDSQRLKIALSAPLGDRREVWAQLTAHLPDGRDLKVSGVYALAQEGQD
jgi:hypothetical protein